MSHYVDDNFFFFSPAKHFLIKKKIVFRVRVKTINSFIANDIIVKSKHFCLSMKEKKSYPMFIMFYYCFSLLFPIHNLHRIRRRQNNDNLLLSYEA